MKIYTERGEYCDHIASDWDPTGTIKDPLGYVLKNYFWNTTKIPSFTASPIWRTANGRRRERCS